MNKKSFTLFLIGMILLVSWGLILSPLLPSYIYVLNGVLLLIAFVIYLYVYFKGESSRKIRSIAIIFIIIGFNIFVGANNISCYPDSIVILRLPKLDRCIWFIINFSESIKDGLFYMVITIISITTIEIGIKKK